MQDKQGKRKLWWFAGGVAAGLAGYLAIRYPVETATKVGRGVLYALGASEREIAWPGGTLRYLMVGRGTRPLVVVHGIGDSPESFALFVRELLPDYRICLPIMPGHPGSPAPAGLKLGHMVQALDAVILREFGAQKVHLLGNSMGGWVSAIFAAAASERLESLTLVNPAGRHKDFRAEMITPRDDADVVQTLRALFGRRADRIPGFFRTAYGRAMNARSEPAVSRMMDEGPRLGEQLTRISVRTMVVIGELDKVVPPEESLEIAELIGHAAVELIPHGSHIPHLTEPRVLARLVNQHATERHLLQA